MSPLNNLRSFGRDLARTGALFSAAMLVASSFTWLTADALPAGSAATPSVSISPQSGTSATSFTLPLAETVACPGDTVSGGFGWSTYMVPDSADPAVLQYDANGPRASVSGADGYTTTFAQPLYNTSGEPVTAQTTGLTSGLITPLPTFSFGVFTPGFIAPGTYKIGYACVKAGRTERFWMLRIAITASTTGGPAQIAFTVPATPPSTTTTVAPTTVAPTTAAPTTVAPTTAAPTTTIKPTTTTVAGATTTTVAGATTTTVAAATTTSVASAGPTTTLGGGGSLPATGSSPTPTVMWGILLLVFGRMAMLLAKPVRVLPPKS
jgi:hypothetical protein